VAPLLTAGLGRLWLGARETWTTHRIAMKVMLVEDDELVRATLVDSLED